MTPAAQAGGERKRYGWPFACVVVCLLFLYIHSLTLPVYLWTPMRFPQTLPTILAPGTCTFPGSVLPIGCAEWLRRMGTQHNEGVFR